MIVFMMYCPELSRKVSTGIRIEGTTWNSAPELVAFTCCPVCGKDHEWSAKDFTLSDEVDTPHVLPLLLGAATTSPPLADIDEQCRRALAAGEVERMPFLAVEAGDHPRASQSRTSMPSAPSDNANPSRCALRSITTPWSFRNHIRPLPSSPMVHPERT